MSELARRERSDRQQWAAAGGSYDRLVKTARIALPALVGVIAALMVFLPLTHGGEVSFVLDKTKVEIAREAMSTQAASYSGADGEGRPFRLTAGSGVQKSSAEPIIDIRDLAASLLLSDGPARFDAPTGRYDMDKQQVALDGPIRFRGPNGYTLDTSNATVDLKGKRMTSNGAVTGTVPQGVFSAATMSADLDRRVVRLDGRARLRIVPGRAR